MVCQSSPVVILGFFMHKQALWERGCDSSRALTGQSSLLLWAQPQLSGKGSLAWDGSFQNKTVRKGPGYSCVTLL